MMRWSTSSVRCASRFSNSGQASFLVVVLYKADQGLFQLFKLFLSQQAFIFCFQLTYFLPGRDDQFFAPGSQVDHGGTLVTAMDFRNYIAQADQVFYHLAHG